MNAFVNAVKTVPVMTRTQNGMKAQESTMSALVDLFYNIGASRGKNIVPEFERAYQQDNDLALRIALWARDIRGGAGERKLFRDILMHLEKHHPEVLINTKILDKVAEVGRWDDLLVFNYDDKIKRIVYKLIYNALQAGNGLCAKWMPRKGPLAAELRRELGLSPKEWRKTLVRLTNVVETPMCAKEYERINYAHVPSLAMSRYMKAFSRNDADRFSAYRESLKKGETKVNAGAVYPYDIIKTLKVGGDKVVADKQWDALPNYMDDQNVLPMVDVSGSMTCGAGGSNSVSCLDIAVSLGLYCADKNKGAFKDTFLTFSGKPDLISLKGTLSEKLVQMERSHWEMNTNLHAAFDRILQTAINGNVPQADMPSILLILSDMQFDECSKYDHSAIEMIRSKYDAAGYTVPVIVFWNLNASGNAPVSFNKKGVCLVSGFSPSIMKAVLSSNLDNLSPESVMRDAVCIPRYDYL